MAYSRIEHAGGAVSTTLNGSITSGDTTAVLAAATGWPTGSTGSFYLVVDPGLATEEKILATTRTTNTLNTLTRGVDGTSASAHSSGAVVMHIFTATEADEANVAVTKTIGLVTTKGDLIVATGNQALGRQAVGANDTLLIADSAQTNGVKYAKVGTANIAAGAVTATELANNAVLTAKIDDGSVTLAKMATDSVDTGQLVDASVTTAKIADNQITNAKMADDSVGTAELVDASIQPVHFAVGAVSSALDQAVTGGPVTGSITTLATLVIPAQPFAYTLDAACFWSAYNSIADNAFRMAIKVDGTTKGSGVNRHTGSANERRLYAIPCIQLTSIPANTVSTVTVTCLRDDTAGSGGSGNLVEEQAGRLRITIYTRVPAA